MVRGSLGARLVNRIFPQTPREWSSNLCCQRIDFFLPMFNQWTMDKKIYQALAKTHTTVKPEFVYLHIGPCQYVVTHRDGRVDSLTVCRQRIGPMKRSASRVRSGPKRFAHPSSLLLRRISTRSAGSGSGAHQFQSMLEPAKTTSSACTSGSHDGSRRRGCRFTLPPAGSCGVP